MRPDVSRQDREVAVACPPGKDEAQRGPSSPAPEWIALPLSFPATAPTAGSRGAFGSRLPLDCSKSWSTLGPLQTNAGPPPAEISAAPGRGRGAGRVWERQGRASALCGEGARDEGGGPARPDPTRGRRAPPAGDLGGGQRVRQHPRAGPPRSPGPNTQPRRQGRLRSRSRTRRPRTRDGPPPQTHEHAQVHARARTRTPEGTQRHTRLRGVETESQRRFSEQRGAGLAEGSEGHPEWSSREVGLSRRTGRRRKRKRAVRGRLRVGRHSGFESDFRSEGKLEQVERVAAGREWEGE